MIGVVPASGGGSAGSNPAGGTMSDLPIITVSKPIFGVIHGGGVHRLLRSTGVTAREPAARLRWLELVVQIIDETRVTV